MSATQVCIVCEQFIEDSKIAPGICPGDWVICIECDKVTPDRRQAEQYWLRHYGEWVRLKKIEEATRKAYAHLSYLDDCGALTREEEPMMKALKEALNQ